MPRILYKDIPTAAEKPAGDQSVSRRRLTTMAGSSHPGSEIIPLAKLSKGPKREREVTSKVDLSGQFVTQPTVTGAEQTEPASSATKAPASDPAEADFPVTQKPSGRKDEELRKQFLGRIAVEFPRPARFSAADVLKILPELGGYQSAYAFLQTARRRGQIEKAERGMFRLTGAAVQELQSGKEPAVEPVSEPKPALAEVPSPPLLPAAAPFPAPKPAVPPAPSRNEQAEIVTLLQLSRRYRSDKYFRLDDIIVPLRECRSEVYGKADIGAGDPPLCVVVGAYEPDLRVLNPQDIDVLFLDANGQAHLRSAASWQFLPYRRKQG